MDFMLFYLAMLVSATIGFVLGAVKYLRPRKPLYASMITLGITVQKSSFRREIQQVCSVTAA
ncbi:MAG: hypothetical protein J6O50_02700 [Ruminiclostridium sp.]|nr:hypothetical protein [Ruminiclostridium sp.]